MATNVEFKFDLDQEVRIKLTGEKGLVDFLGFDDGGKQYHVKTGKDSSYWKENQIESVEA